MADPTRSSSRGSQQTAGGHGHGDAHGRRRLRVRVTGTVQGVGFRPYVYRLARELGLGGWVLNDAHGVLIEVEGDAVDAFVARLGPEAPPLAVVEGVAVDDVAATGDASFVIRSSPRGEAADAPVTPDTATCADCLGELFDPGDRRYRYPFTNCTNCGPRFTIVRGIPYDRPYTTMAGFEMCPACQAEYDDPADRRFHAQPNACPVCGPSVSLISLTGSPGVVETGDPIAAAAHAMREGAILAIKGIGGYHLACCADDETVVAKLRARKHREDKPFALMVSDPESLVWLGDDERALLESPERPIVLARRRAGTRVAASVAPGAPELGVMLPYSPLHHLLVADAGLPLVMTSGNVSDEPIAFGDDDAIKRLAGIADGALIHDRPIETRTDDSVVRVTAGRRVFVRRSRGYVPASVALPVPLPADRPVLACGAELKNTFCVAKGTRAWVGHHIGDLQNYETLRSFADGVAHFERLFSVEPSVVAHDLHPEYLSTKYALDQDGEVELVGVQHHHAHLAACLAEHGIVDGVAVGAIFDGTGYGTDETIWGGEILVGGVTSFERAGSLRAVPLPGGERAIAEPWRMACAWLGAPEEVPDALRDVVEEKRWRAVAQMVRSGLQSPMTTSVGRLFDAIAALSGLRVTVNYEGQAAIELEAAADLGERGAYAFDLADPTPLIEAVVADLAGGVAAGVVSARFHRGLAAATVRACVAAAGDAGTEIVVLSGGVFLNRLLLEAVVAGLEAAGLRVLVPSVLPPGDGGISYGQAAVAAARMAAS